MSVVGGLRRLSPLRTVLLLSICVIASLGERDVDIEQLGGSPISLLQTSFNFSAKALDAPQIEHVESARTSQHSDRLKSSSPVQSASRGPHAVTASEKISQKPRDTRVFSLRCLAGSFAVLGFLSSLSLIRRHYRVGTILSGAWEPHPRARQAIELIVGVPLFSALSIWGLCLPELGYVWQLLQIEVLNATFRKMPDLLCSVAGGALPLQLQIKADRAKGDCGDEPVNMYANVPCCCIRSCVHDRPPFPQDVSHLSMGVVQMLLVLRFCAIVDLVTGLERIMGSAYFRFTSQWEPVGTVLSLLSIAVCVASMGGLEQIVKKYNRKASEILDLEAKQMYARTYLVGLNFLPLVVSMLPLRLGKLRNGNVLQPWEEAEVLRSVAICVAAFLCAKSAERAFPADANHYPELENARLEDTETALKKTMYCPLCGSDSLQVEPYSLEKQTSACKSCGANEIPASLLVRVMTRSPKQPGQ